MQTRHLKIQFHTPAFLGDANQSGRWRTPPFKAQLRQWWRVAYAAKNQFAVNVREMRDIEGHLFGHAWLENDRDEDNNKVAARKSWVRIRLSRWDEGQLKSWDRLEAGTVFHPEAEKVRCQVGPHAYLGYGPLDGRSGTKLQDKQGKPNAAIQANEKAELAVAYPDEHAPLLDQALQLMDLYGTVGGRSRNGWGSYSINPSNGGSLPGGATPSQALAKCLSMDWPHALGSDSQGALVWQTLPHKDWAGLMRTLAEIKIKLRTQAAFKFPHAQSDGQVHDRHWLSYPITRHDVNDWKRKNLRLPNQLRFKVRHANDGLVGVIFHMPHLPPAEFRPDPKTLESIWRTVHGHLGTYERPAPEIAHLKLTRIAA
jgi:CRISPR-associated protein Cmr1